MVGLLRRERLAVQVKHSSLMQVRTGADGPTLARVETVKNAVDVPTKVAAINVVKDGREAVVSEAPAEAPASAESIEFVQNYIESDEDMLTLLETGAHGQVGYNRLSSLRKSA